ncbi:Uncharacterized conserved protein [Mycobacteroides abscessus subsp. massiliense]|uniref:DUF1254 domain-containing protein n=1 Tax=Mycobacteroides abscessus TaxID=36809 RepID=UPI0009A81B39|nr:DUF1254 domain-containing protein [Mycobacteroides abscessus]SKH91029.1 Uncharacterized conserved protein [Mycobacteroides abscessus subsp. massiliense]SKH92572.1 Uncharacterized conserved protein [Mycobacteroides abscessus subsp. massiliense]SKI13342.1 Uncharacterized conserved protein [Mycobacteroides abscessus subsp. massiliense]SKK30112.1 Uncharacterized conserved protein [Mycobacteroides abscessus subsp. massiliense]SKK36531.1 Uncharacterized conserved protein [Mycobacteroides abscessu
MQTQRLRLPSWCALTAVALVAVAGCGSPATDSGPIDGSLSTADIERITGEAFDWGLNIAGFYELRLVYTQQDGPAFRGINRIQPQLDLFNAKTSRIATTVNASTLYSGGMFDLTREPIVIETPAVNDNRYWSVQGSDQYADWFFKAGTQFTGNAAQRFLIVGPHWHGKLPPGFTGIQIVRSPSDSIVISTRVAVDSGTDTDMAAARAVVQRVGMVPLSQWTAAGGHVPPLARQPKVKGDYRSFPRMDQISDIAKAMTPTDFLQLLSLAVNDPSLTRKTDSVKETQTLHDLAELGVKPGEIFDPAKISPDQRAAIERGFTTARRRAHDAFLRSQIDMNGWQLQSDLFSDPLDYRAKAGADDVAWGTPVPYQSHTIAYLFTDADGRDLDGGHRYTLTFDTSNLPPTTQFWELPVYDSYGYFIENPINRYSATSGQYNSVDYSVVDGKLTFYLQPDSPADPEQARNWLPTPRNGNFQLAARFYGPTSPLLDGSYPMPRAQRTN